MFSENGSVSVHRLKGLGASAEGDPLEGRNN